MSSRTEILTNAAELISGDRAKSYGDAKENFERIGRMWGEVLNVPAIDGDNVALMMVQLKIARIIGNPFTHNEDSWTDAAGYIALGAEIATN